MLAISTERLDVRLWLPWDANDLHAEVTTWQNGDISKTSRVEDALRGDLIGVLKTIRAKALIMPSETDMLFYVRSLPPKTPSDLIGVSGRR